MRPVCVTCSCEMRCEKNGQIVQEVGHGDWGYRSGDTYKCPKCSHEIVVGCGDRMYKDSIPDDEMKLVIKVGG